MKKVMTAHVGSDGVLNLSVSLGPEDANKTVRVTVEAVEEAAEAATLPTDRQAWLQFIERTAGSIPDPTFDRRPQGEYEERDPLP
jgi:hypothetical protein